MSLFIVLIACLQDKLAEDAFKKIEETIRQAKTVSATIKYASEVKNSAKERKTNGTIVLLLKDGNKASLGCKTIDNRGKATDFSIVSNGSKSAIAQGGDSEETETPKKLRENLAIALARVGGTYATLLTRRLSANERNEIPEFQETLILSDFKATEDDGEAKTLTYKANVTALGRSLDVKVWYIAKTGTMLKRVFKQTGGDEEGSVTETYEELTFNADTPDEKFKLPPGK